MIVWSAQCPTTSRLTRPQPYIFGLAPVTERRRRGSCCSVCSRSRGRRGAARRLRTTIVQRGPQHGRAPPDSEVTNAGRSPKADIFLDDDGLAQAPLEFIAFERRPAIVRFRFAQRYVYVNRERVDSIELHAGDEV